MKGEGQAAERERGFRTSCAEKATSLKICQRVGGGGFLASSRVVLMSLKGADEFQRVLMFSKRDKPEKLRN